MTTPGDHPALGNLTGEVYRALERARDAKDKPCLAVLRWVHEIVCAARYKVDDMEWPATRKIPRPPKFKGRKL